MPSKPRLVDLRGGRKIPPPKPEDVRPHSPRRSVLRVKKRRLRAVITAGISVCILFTGYAIHAASYMPRFTYQNISVTGTTHIPAAEIQKFVAQKLAESSRGFVSGRNIFVFNYASLAPEIVANFPTAKLATVTRDTSLGNGLIVTIEERTPFSLWCSGGASAGCYILDETGIVFMQQGAIASTTLPTQYVFSGALSTTTENSAQPPYGQVFAGEHFEGMYALLKLLKESGVTPLGVRLESEPDFSVPLAEGFYLKASYGEEAQTLTKNLALILNSDALKGKMRLLDYVDLRFGNRVYYRFKNEQQKENTASQ